MLNDQLVNENINTQQGQMEVIVEPLSTGAIECSYGLCFRNWAEFTIANHCTTEVLKPSLT